MVKVQLKPIKNQDIIEAIGKLDLQKPTDVLVIKIKDMRKQRREIISFMHQIKQHFKEKNMQNSVLISDDGCGYEIMNINEIIFTLKKLLENKRKLKNNIK